jgi:hypothetical protein
MKRLFLKAMAAGAGIMLVSSAGVRGTVLYQDTLFNTGQVMNFPSGDQIGEQIWLGTGTTPMYLTNFSFQYYSPVTSYVGPVQADVILYQNNGAPFNGYSTPGSAFFVSGWFDLPNPWSLPSATNSATAVFQLSDLQAGAIGLAPNFILPSNFTFSVTFRNLQGADSVGLPIFNPPSVGFNAGDYWYDVSGNWELLTNSIGPIAFGAQFLGTPIPEPSGICLGALGLVALTAMARRRRG